MNTLNIHPSQLAVLPTNPSVDEAVEYMKTSMDIVDWNLKRARVIRAVGRQEFLNNYIPSNDSYVAKIDTQGLIVAVLGKDSKNKKSYHKPFKYKQNGRR